jgi:hypothetical protein
MTVAPLGWLTPDKSDNRTCSGLVLNLSGKRAYQASGLLSSAPSLGNNRPAAGKTLHSKTRLEHCTPTGVGVGCRSAGSQNGNPG